MNAEQLPVTELYGDFRISVERRLTALEKDIEHKANKNEIAGLKVWILTGIASGFLAIGLVLLNIIFNLIKMLIETG